MLVATSVFGVDRVNLLERYDYPKWAKLQGGANDGALFAPKYVENKLKFFRFIKEAVAFGDRRETVCAFVHALMRVSP